MHAYVFVDDFLLSGRGFAHGGANVFARGFVNGIDFFGGDFNVEVGSGFGIEKSVDDVGFGFDEFGF